MRTLAAALLTALLATPAATPAWAEEQPVVVELFTSQGCATCPPADALLAEIARMEGVIALSLHVDYWDYLGWPDPYASPAFTARQWAYGEAAGERGVYTPQVIVNGLDRVEGGRTMEVMERLHAHKGAETPVSLRLRVEGGRLAVAAEAEGPVGPLDVELVRFVPSETVTIPHGENAGHTVEYANVVTSWRSLGRWDGREPLWLSVPLSGPEPAVVLLQEPGPGRILAAARAE